jgi:hypothetical protein
MRSLSSYAIGLLAVAVGGVVCFAMMLMAATPKTPTGLSTCTFVGNSAVTGSCGHLFNQTPEMTLRLAHSVVGGVWRSGSSPSTVWYGDMTDQGYPNAPIQLQIYDAGSGILQTIYGWFPVTQYRTTPSGIAFELDGVHEVSPNVLDAQIIRRAAEILSSPVVWNRADDRKCPPNATTWSIFCAGVRAVEEVTGGTGGGHGIDHRRPALEVIRGVVDDRSKGRSYHHNLMGYNNDSTTTFTDMQSLFSEALRAMDDHAWLAAHGFSAK